MTRLKTDKVEIRYTPDQKAAVKKLSYDLGYEGNISDMYRNALEEYVQLIYAADPDRAREIIRAIRVK